MNQAEAFLQDQVPMALRPLIPATLKTAYAAVSSLVQAEAILQVASAQDNRGRLVQWGVDLAFERLVKSGQWPFEYRWRPFARPTGRYLEIRPSHAVLTISQVADPKKQPRDVRFRANKRLANQGWLQGLPNPKEEAAPGGEPHILLIHGHQGLNFAHLAMPNEDHRKGYRFKTNNLLMMPHGVEEPEHPLEDTDIDAVMTLKDEIDRWRRDNG